MLYPYCAEHFHFDRGDKALCYDYTGKLSYHGGERSCDHYNDKGYQDDGKVFRDDYNDQLS